MTEADYSWRWWHCRDCDVKWSGTDDVCWSCETSMRKNYYNRLAAS